MKNRTKFLEEEHSPSCCQVAAAVIGGAVIGAGASTAAASKQSKATGSAAAIQAESTQDQLALQREMYNQNVQRMQPFVEAGQGALGQLQRGTAAGGEFTKGFDASTFAQDPSYKFRLEQGMQQLQGSAAARGGLMSGQGLQDITNYAQGAASQEYGNAFNRYQQQQLNRFNILSGVAGSAQNAAAGLGTQGGQVAGQMAQTQQAGTGAQLGYLTSGANAQAAGMMGVGNAVQGGVNNYMGWNYLQSMRQPGAAAGSPYGGSGAVGAPGNAGYGDYNQYYDAGGGSTYTG